MYSATVQLTVLGKSLKPWVSPIGGKLEPLSFNLGSLQNSPPDIPRGSTVPVVTLKDGASGDSSRIVISIPQTYGGWVEFKFQLFSTQYVLLGVAFGLTPDNAPLLQFPEFRINRDDECSELTLVDACRREPNFLGRVFTYYLLVHDVTNNVVGIIDPEIENDIVG